MQKYFDDNDILLYSTPNKSKSVVAERFIRTLKSKIYENWKLTIANFIVVFEKISRPIQEYLSLYYC